MEGSSELGLEKYKISKRMQLNASYGGSGDKLDSVHGGRLIYQELMECMKRVMLL